MFEYVEGETLKDRIRRVGRLPIAEAVAYAIEIARALGAAHARHIVHRDVKPQNVLIDEEGSAKVTDFGIARTLDEEGLTADGRVLGTTDYVSPEQALGQQVTGQSDLYSLGIVLYEMLTGEVPFKGENQVAVAMKHVRESLPDVQTKRPEVSAALAAVVDNATAKRQEDRYANDAELIADLEDVLAIETARAGSATGEVTSVLRTLPSSTQRRVPFRLRHRIAAVLALRARRRSSRGAVVWLATAHPPRHRQARPAAAGRDAVAGAAARQSCRARLRPARRPPTSIPTRSALAIDGQPDTAWTTETYSERQPRQGRRRPVPRRKPRASPPARSGSTPPRPASRSRSSPATRRPALTLARLGVAPRRRRRTRQAARGHSAHDAAHDATATT